MLDYVLSAQNPVSLGELAELLGIERSSAHRLMATLIKYGYVIQNENRLYLPGAMKNVIAIAAGIVDGIKAGDNAKAALLCRGLAEITRLGLALGAKEQTFSGLSGLGDLVTTCISPMGRNRSFGQRIGAGQNVEDALGATASVVEGAATCKSIVDLAKQHSIDMPITEAVEQILFCGKGVLEAIEELMKRKPKAE